MKKTCLSILSILCLCSLSVYAADKTLKSPSTHSNNSPSFEKMGPPPQDGNFTNSPAGAPKGAPQMGQRPNKKPDSKPGGDRVPPEFQGSQGHSSQTTHSK